MKKYLLSLILCIVCFFYTFSRDYNFTINAYLGGTIVDVAEAIGYEMEEWDNFSFGISATGTKNIDDDFSIGGEVGFHRLYYYEYIYDYPSQVGYDNYSIWGTISTVYLGPVAELLNDKRYLQGGLNLHIFTDGSGISPGILLGGGFRFELDNDMVIPIGGRIEIIFGSATPVSINLVSGISFGF